MNSVNGIRKYYIGLGLLFLITIGCLVYTISQAGAAKADKLTNKAVQQIAQKLETYTIQKGIPSSLAEAGITDVPDTVKYTKIDDTKYKICLDYKTASSGFDAGWWSLLGGQIDSGSNNYSTGDHSYFDSTVEYNHKKGENCQTISDTYGGYLNSSSTNQTNYSTSTASPNYSTSACSTAYDSYYGLQGQATVASVNTSAKTISFNASGQTVTDENGKAQPAVTSMKYDSITLFCSASGQETTAAAIKSGNQVKFYASSSGSTTLDKVQL